MRISFIEPHLKVYGGIRRILELANRLTERGHEVTIFHSDGSPCSWMKCIAKVKNYSCAVKEDHEVLIYNSPHPVDYYLVKNARARVKIFYVLALYERNYLKGRIPLSAYLINPKKGLRLFFVQKSLHSPCLKLTNATWMREWLKENMNIDSKLLLGGVSFDVFHPIAVEKNPNEIRILCAGDPRERKGTHDIFRAFQLAKRWDQRLVLDTFYGKGIPQKEMARVYCRADIFVDGQWYAGWNNPVAEAMACRLPVICTDIGGVQDFAIQEKTALLVPARDPEAMASTMLRLAEEAELRELLRENAYRHIQQFSWEKSADTLEEILHTELEG